MFRELLGKRYEDYLGFIRRRMIKDQIESRGVKDARVLAAMEKVCRHCFVTEDMVTRSYEDYPLPIERGQTISQPYVVALMSEMLGLKGEEKVLEIGTGSGYQTAVLAELAKRVCTVEIFPDLAERARSRLGALGYSNISFRTGNGTEGWQEEAPFDAVMVTCAAAEVPPALISQLSEGGRLLMPVGGPESQELRLLRRTPSGIEESSGEPVRFVPMLDKE